MTQAECRALLHSVRRVLATYTHYRIDQQKERLTVPPLDGISSKKDKFIADISLRHRRQRPTCFPSHTSRFGLYYLSKVELKSNFAFIESLRVKSGEYI